jgi:hypothetical protein
MAFYNFTAGPRLGEPTSVSPLPKPSRGQIMTWRVSKRMWSPDSIVPPLELSPELRDSLSAGRVVGAESDGLVNLVRVVGNPGGPFSANAFDYPNLNPSEFTRWGFALASTTLTSDRPRTVTLRFGYSQGINVLLNGRSVFVGLHPSDYPEFGRMLGDANVVELPLRRGANELVFAITDRVFGWGFRARLENGEGVKFSAPKR